MKNPSPINLTPTNKVKSHGWAAEARDAEGHLISMQAWGQGLTINENLKMLGEFIAKYEPDMTVTVFRENLLM